MAAASNGSDYFVLDIDPASESFVRPSNADAVEEDEDQLMWEAISHLPSQKRGTTAILKRTTSEYAAQGGGEPVGTIDVTELDRAKRELVVKNALATNEQDNSKFLAAIKERLDRGGIEVPKVEVRFKNLTVKAKVQIGSRALPTLINAARDSVEGLLRSLKIFRDKRLPLTILKDVGGIVKPGRMTLLLGPPGSGKSTLLLALAGKLDENLKTTGSITYNGEKLNEFYVKRTSAYTSQTDNHIAELTVRETLDFAASWQGASKGFAGYMEDHVRLEKERNIRPSPEVDAFMKASSVGGKKHIISTDYVLKVLGLDVCSETVVSNDMLRGVSGGQKKRMEATVLMALLQPAPETFDLFDDLVLLSEGYVVYQGPRAEVFVTQSESKRNRRPRSPTSTAGSTDKSNVPPAITIKRNSRKGVKPVWFKDYVQ